MSKTIKCKVAKKLKQKINSFEKKSYNQTRKSKVLWEQN